MADRGHITVSARIGTRSKRSWQRRASFNLALEGLRHTVGTILAEMGRDNATIALVLGHATEAMATHYSRRADRSKQAQAVAADFEAELNKRKTKVVKL
ncbi:hypothetical protein [Agrobacterium sp. OT33]|uniref:hypothetical protein n=1 Tax=Agrobacterium sp. OT33 TaxID=2815338 RepID=UPI001A9074E3|nr:hypothetical protein [Agrobacterium sp. OT33]MBO0124406.1 hypothetical protein [Agrobacterium sp. OT33]